MGFEQFLKFGSTHRLTTHRLKTSGQLLRV